MGDLVFLAAGYAVIWLVAFIFIYSLVRRQKTIQHEVRILEALVQDEADQEST